MATLAKAPKDDYLSNMTLALIGIGIGALEIGVILLVVLLVFGPSKLPQLGEGIGKMLRGFKKEMKGMEDDKKADEAKDSKAVEGSRGDDKSDDEIDVTPKKDVDAEKVAKKPA
jgi:sec-independent protein translocase protein TatA